MKQRLNGLLYTPPCKWDRLVVIFLAVAGFFLWNHPDIVETAQHTQILLKDIFSGNFFAFYQDTMDAKAVLGYANAAHYHILFYVLCAIWDLPLYLLSLVLPVSNFAFVLWTKAFGTLAWILCGFLLQKVASLLDISVKYLPWTGYGLWLCPIAFFTVLGMGQYDSLCLLFILGALYLYLQDKLLAFSLVMGMALVFKMFALFVFVPLLLLREKRLLRVLGYLVIGMWLYLPGTLLFAGRNGDASFFNSLIAQRLFAQVLPFVAQPSILLVALAALWFICWLWKPANQNSLHQKAIYVCLVTFSLLFLLVQWHPQWLILLTPFVLLTNWQSNQSQRWMLLHGISVAGFFLMTAYLFVGQIEANLFDFGIIGQWFGVTISGSAQQRTNTVYFDLIPYLAQLAPVAFSAPIIIGLFGKFPLKGKQLFDRLCPPAVGAPSIRLWLYGTFVVTFGAFWFIPSAFAWIKTLGIL